MDNYYDIIKHHSDLTIKDYQVLDNILIHYDFLVKDGDKTAGVIYTKKYQYYYALKSTKSGDTIFLTSFRKTNKHDIKRIRNKSERGLVSIIIDKNKEAMDSHPPPSLNPFYKSSGTTERFIASTSCLYL